MGDVTFSGPVVATAVATIFSLVTSAFAYLFKRDEQRTKEFLAYVQAQHKVQTDALIQDRDFWRDVATNRGHKIDQRDNLIEATARALALPQS